MEEREVRDESRLLLAVRLFEEGAVSAGMAAKIAGMDKVTFLYLLHRYGALAPETSP